MKTIEERADIYEEISGCYGCQLGQVKEAFIAGAKSEHEELTKWNSPECPPEHSNTVLVKTPHGDTFYYSLGNYYQGQWHISAIHNEILGWREIHE